jgi:2-oxoglutarate ferredoxin oxidoreductase subunit alpha
LHAHQGEFPRIVLAAGDVKEAFELTAQAFNLADKYQTPVVVLLDKNICDNDQSTLFFDTSQIKINRGKFTKEQTEGYMRYKYEPDGISQRSIPGTSNFFIANSDEHDEYGYSTEDIEIRNRMMEKRMKKLRTCEAEDMKGQAVFGPNEADITLVSWGSNKGSVLEALKNFSNVNFVYLTWMNPFPSEELRKLLSNSKHIIDIESNYTGQMADLIREKTGIKINDRLLKYDGRMIFPEEIIEKVAAIKGAKRI